MWIQAFFCVALLSADHSAKADRLPQSSKAEPSPAAESDPPPGRPGDDADLPQAVELSVWTDPNFQRSFAESYRAVTEVEPRVTEAERKLLRKVLGLLGEGETERARVLIDKSITDASSASLDFTLGNLYFGEQEWEKAQAAYTRATDKFPRFLRAWKQRGYIDARGGDLKPATSELIRVLQLGGADSVTYGLLGFSHLGLGNTVAAESAYRMAVLLDPDNVDWKRGLARCFFDMERFQEAASLCGSMIKEDPTRTDLWLLQARAFLGLEQPTRAAENLAIVERLGGGSAETLANLGDICINAGSPGLGVETYLRGLHEYGGVLVDRGLRATQALAQAGHLEDAARLAGAIEEAAGDDAGEDKLKQILKVRARIAMASGAGDEQAAALERVVDEDPLDGEALLLLGQLAQSNGDPERAIFYFERAGGIEAFEAEAKLQHARLLVRRGEYAAGARLLRRVQELEPRESVARYLEQVERAAKRR